MPGNRPPEGVRHQYWAGSRIHADGKYPRWRRGTTGTREGRDKNVQRLIYVVSIEKAETAEDGYPGMY